MNTTMGKKIGNAGLLIGGLLGLIGAVLAFVNSATVSVNGVIGMAIMARIGSIIMFISAIAVVAVTFMGKDQKKGGEITKIIFGAAAFVGQFLINPYTGLRSMVYAGFSGNMKSTLEAAVVGFIIIAVSGLTLLIMGIVGLASKNKNNNNNLMGQ